MLKHSSTQSLTSDQTASLLRKIIADCTGKPVLFDLDSTLLNNRPRNAAIMREFATYISEPLLSQATAEHFPTWSAEQSMALLGLSTQAIDNLLDDYLEFWELRFFTSEYCKYDVAIAGAARFVNAISTGAQVTYLTGRDESMREGTQRSLHSLGFPTPAEHKNTQLIMKPVARDSDDEFKHDVSMSMATYEAIAAAFDNEPSHINSYREVFSEAICVHLDTDHSMREVRLLEGIVSIRNFEY